MSGNEVVGSAEESGPQTNQLHTRVQGLSRMLKLGFYVLMY